MTTLGTILRRRFNAIDALDKLVARECEAIGELDQPPAPHAAEPKDDGAFIDGAIAYLSGRPNALELMAAIDHRLKATGAPAATDSDPAATTPDAGQDETDAAPEPAP